MELLTNQTKLENAIQALEENMKKKNRVLPASMRKSLLKLLNKHSNLVTVKGKKIIISSQFYPVWVQEHKLNQDTEEIDAQHYKFFRKLSKYGLIHANSSYFPKKLAVITLNPTIPSLYKGNMRHITNYTRGKQALYKNDSTQSAVNVYIDLRIYQPFMLTTKEVEAINVFNIIFIDEDIAYIYFEDKGIFENVEIPPYSLVRIRGSKLIATLKKYKQDGVIYPFSNTVIMENELLKYKQKFFSEMGMQEIRMSSQNYLLMSSSPLIATLATSRKIMSKVSISELRCLFPSAAIPEHLIKLEDKRILNAIERSKKFTDEKEDAVDASFSLEEFDYFNELIKTKNSSSFMKKKEPAKRELLQYSNSENPETHGILITKYIAHLLESVNGDKKTRKIAISTFRNYYSLVKKHLFNNVEDLASVQTHEISEILQNLATNKYKDKSITKVRSLITDFFRFHGEQHNVIPMNLASYPKSLVFEYEIDPILSELEDGTDYKILRDQAIVLMARYTGLRKNELRTRLMKDIYIYGNELYIDVNSEGLRKLDMKLKTSSAKRRVCTAITNNNHLKIIIDYIEAREKVKNKNSFFFLHVDDKNKIKSKVAREDVFNQISKIIQDVTGRYTSFHSLRHTYATYAVLDILKCEKINPYKMIDLAVKMGHTSPEITLKKYTHRSVIESEDILCI